MKVSLSIPKDAEVPFLNQNVRLNEIRNGTRRIDVVNVAFAEVIESGDAVEVRTHNGGTVVIGNAQIQASYDM